MSCGSSASLTACLGWGLGCTENDRVLNTQEKVSLCDTWLFGPPHSMVNVWPVGAVRRASLLPSGGPGGRGGRAQGWAQESHVVCLSGLPTVVKLVDRDALLREREEKQRVGTQELGLAACWAHDLRCALHTEESVFTELLSSSVCKGRTGGQTS